MAAPDYWASNEEFSLQRCFVGFSADLSEEQLQQKLKEMREHLKREIRKVSVCCWDIRVEQIQLT